MEERDPLTREVIGAAIEVHRELGPGLSESVYRACMEHELRLRGIDHEPQKPLPVVYKGKDCGSRRTCAWIFTSQADSSSG